MSTPARFLAGSIAHARFPAAGSGRAAVVTLYDEAVSGDPSPAAPPRFALPFGLSGVSGTVSAHVGAFFDSLSAPTETTFNDRYTLVLDVQPTAVAAVPEPSGAALAGAAVLVCGAVTARRSRPRPAIGERPIDVPET